MRDDDGVGEYRGRLLRRLAARRAQSLQGLVQWCAGAYPELTAEQLADACVPRTPATSHE